MRIAALPEAAAARRSAAEALRRTERSAVWIRSAASSGDPLSQPDHDLSAVQEQLVFRFGPLPVQFAHDSGLPIAKASRQAVRRTDTAAQHERDEFLRCSHSRTPRNTERAATRLEEPFAARCA